MPLPDSKPKPRLPHRNEFNTEFQRASRTFYHSVHHVTDHYYEDSEDGSPPPSLPDRNLFYNGNAKMIVRQRCGRMVYGTKKSKESRKGKKRSADGCDLYVVRLRRDADGLWGLSKPCKECLEVLHSLGIRRVFYSTGANTWTCEKVSLMQTTYQTSGVIALQEYKKEDRNDKKRKRRKS
jgi:hypothetical protein